MFPLKQLQIPRAPKGSPLAILLLILLPFPIGIPLALWLTSHRPLPNAPLAPPVPPTGTPKDSP